MRQITSIRKVFIISLFAGAFFVFDAFYVSAAANPNGLDNFVVLGKGCTTAYYIDKDCDGYGVGVRSDGQYEPLSTTVTIPGLTGDMPDADDNDATINNPQSIISAGYNLSQEADLRRFLNEHKGHSNINRVFYINPGANWYNDWTTVFSQLAPGDIILFREGTYARAWGVDLLKSGTAERPIIIAAYPGERVVINGSSQGMVLSSDSKPTSNIIVDGFIFDSQTASRGGQGILFGFSRNIIIRNIETVNCRNGVMSMQDMHEILIEESIVHDSLHHGMYLGAREYPNSNITVRNNIFYANGDNTGWPAFQHNGRVSNLSLEGNIFHSNDAAAITYLNGPHDSFIRNNLIFNNAGGILLRNDSQTTNGIFPYPVYNNIIENNTIWVNQLDVYGSSNRIASAEIVIQDEMKDGVPAESVSNTIRKNIIIGYDAAAIKITNFGLVQSQIIENNIFFRRNAGQWAYPDRIFQSCETDGSSTGNYSMGQCTWYTDSSTMYYWKNSTLQSLNANFRNNLLVEDTSILFTSANFSDYASPGKFDFTDLPTSPAIALDAGADLTTTPPPVNPPPPPPPPATIYGDVSGDGVVNASDVLLLAQHIVGLTTLNSTQTNRGDVSGNGQVTAYDVSLILKKVLGLINAFPVE